MMNCKVDLPCNLNVEFKYVMNTVKNYLIACALGISFTMLISCQPSEDDQKEDLYKNQDVLRQSDIDAVKQELKNADQAGLSISDTYYHMALLDEKNWAYNSMKVNLQKALQIDPENVYARLALGRALLYFNDLDGTLLQTERVLEQESENQEALLLNATAQFKQNSLVEALLNVDKVLALDFENTKAISLKVQILMKKGKFEEALSLINMAIQQQPGNLAYYDLKIELDIKMEDMSAVINDYKTLLTLYPEKEEFSYALAEIYIQERRLNEAEKIYLKLVADNPDNQSHKLSLLTFLKKHDQARAQSQLKEYLDQYKVQPQFLIQFSEWLIENENFAQAKTTLQQIVELEPNSPLGLSAQFLKARIALESNDLELSLSIVNEVLKKNPDYHDAVFLKGRIFLLQKETDQAIALLSSYLLSDPWSDIALVLLAKAYKQSGDRVKATKLYSQAFEMNPGNMQAALAEYDRAMDKNNLRSANQVLEKALEYEPDSIALLQKMAMIRIAEKKWDEALEIAIEFEQRLGAKMQASLVRGKVFEEQGKFLKAIETYKRILNSSPHNVDALNAMFASYESLGKRKAFISYLNLFIEKNPLNMDAYILKSRLYQLEKKPADAINIINQALSIDDKNAMIYTQLASIYNSIGNKSKQQATYKLGLRNIPGNINLTLLLASFYDKKGEFKKAESLYENLIEQNPDLDIAVSKLVFILTDRYGDEGNLKRAKLLARRFENVDQPILSDTYAWVEFKLGNVKYALKIFKKNVLFKPDIAVFKYHLGAAYFHVGKNGLAMAELHQAINLSKTQEFIEVSSASKLLEEIKEAR